MQEKVRDYFNACFFHLIVCQSIDTKPVLGDVLSFIFLLC